MESQALYTNLGRLIECMPDLISTTQEAKTLKWLGDAYAVVNASKDLLAASELKIAINSLTTNAGFGVIAQSRAEEAIRAIHTILYRALSVAELAAPIASQGNFIPVGNAFDVIAAISKLLANAKNCVMFIDPYMDDKALTEFAVLLPEKVAVKLLTDSAGQKPSLEPAVRKWIVQYDKIRPLEARYTPARTLHDRLIIVDDSEVWVLTQSLNAFATRSPASIVRFNEPKLKIDAYNAIWQSSTAI